MSRTDLNDDEFDVELLAQKISRVVKRMFRWLFFPLKVLRAKPLRLASFLLSGVLVSVVFLYTLPYTYQSSFIIKPMNRGDLFFINLLVDLSNLVSQQDYPQLASELGLSEEIASKVKKISVDIVRSNKSKDTVEIVIIYILTTDRTLFDTVQRSIVRYMETRPYYDKIRQLKTADIQELGAKLGKDLGEMDRLKRTVEQSMTPRDAGGYVFGEPVNPVDIYEEELKLYRQQMGLKWQSGYVNNFELVKSCVPTNRPYFPKLSVLLPLCLGLALLFCYMYNLWKKDYSPPEQSEEPKVISSLIEK